MLARAGCSRAGLACGVGFTPPRSRINMASKRSSSPVSALVKRTKTGQDSDDPQVQQMVVTSSGDKAAKGALIQSVRRTSGLNAPIMSLNVSFPPF